MNTNLKNYLKDLMIQIENDDFSKEEFEVLSRIVKFIERTISAKGYRKAGCIKEAILEEQNAQYHYSKLPEELRF